MPVIRAELQRPRDRIVGALIHDPSQVLYLPFDHDDGSYARDRSGYNNHGTIYGASKVPGKVAGALNFDGVDDYIAIPDSTSLHVTSAITLMVWTRVLSAAIEQFTYPILKEFAYRIMHGWGLARYNFGLYIDGAMRSSSYYNENDNLWHFIAGTYSEESRTMRLYVDGILRVSNPLTGLASYSINPSTNPLYIQEGYFRGRVVDIDEVRIISRELSAAGIVRVMNLRGV